MPSLGEARRHAQDHFRLLAATVALAPIERYGPSLPTDKLPEARKLLCVSIGKIYAFLRDTFGEIVASDPRSRHDADYFLSRRFARRTSRSRSGSTRRCIELHDLLEGLTKACSAEFTDLLSRLSQERMIPPEPGLGADPEAAQQPPRRPVAEAQRGPQPPQRPRQRHGNAERSCLEHLERLPLTPGGLRRRPGSDRGAQAGGRPHPGRAREESGVSGQLPLGGQRADVRAALAAERVSEQPGAVHRGLESPASRGDALRCSPRTSSSTAPGPKSPSAASDRPPRRGYVTSRPGRSGTEGTQGPPGDRRRTQEGLHAVGQRRSDYCVAFRGQMTVVRV